MVVVVVMIGGRLSGEHRRGWGRNGLLHSLDFSSNTPPVATIEPHKGQGIHHEVRREEDVKYYFHVVRLLAHEVVDGVRNTENQVADEDRQHGPCGMVHHGELPRLALTGCQATLVPLNLRKGRSVD